ncbi:MAG: hypothetical protein ACNS63_00715 [Candidatus Nitrospinota bacterium M3_3B_026]
MKVARLATAFMLVITITACGGGGGGGSSSEDTSGPSPKDIIGNLKFVFNVVDEFTHRYTVDGKTTDDEKTSDGTDMYIGYDADNSNDALAVAWYPSLSKYLAVATTALNDTFWTYDFTITDTGGLRGCFRMMIGDTLFDCYALKDVSQRFPLGVWARTGKPAGDMDNRLFEMVTVEKAGMDNAARTGENIGEFMELKAALEARN